MKTKYTATNICMQAFSTLVVVVIILWCPLVVKSLSLPSSFCHRVGGWVGDMYL